jgi:hypothetical protein
MTQKSPTLPTQLNLKFVTFSLHYNVWMRYHTALLSRIASSNVKDNGYEPLVTHKVDTFPYSMSMGSVKSHSKQRLFSQTISTS